MVKEVKVLASILNREKEAEKYEKFVEDVMSIVNERLRNLREEQKLSVYPALMSIPTLAATQGSGLYDAIALTGLNPLQIVLASILLS